MAPIKIQHVVSFSSQDPKHPAENLLSGDADPWLSCPQDRSRQLKVELQLEHASPIGYIDIGNCGSAFLQIDVGRSSWPLEQPFLTLLPTTTLMAPAEAKLGKNKTGVRMFKEGDFLSVAMSEKWDRVRVTCSQPFNKQAQFGLSFLRISTPPEENENEDTPPAAGQSQEEPAPGETAAGSWLSSPAICRTFFSEPQPNRTEEDLKCRLHQMDQGSAPRVGNQLCLSRTARMVISAARSGKRTFLAGPSTSPGPPPSTSSVKRKSDPLVDGEEAGTSQEASGSLPDTSITPPPRRGGVKLRRKKVAGRPGALGRSLPTASFRSRTSFLGRGRSRTRAFVSSCKRPDAIHMPHADYEQGEISRCPICGSWFKLDFLPIHASTCGEAVCPHGVPLISSDEDSSSEDSQSSCSPGTSTAPAYVPCPLCGIEFRASVIERHASACAEEMDSESHQSSTVWLE